jgi:hypothetical protein
LALRNGSIAVAKAISEKFGPRKKTIDRLSRALSFMAVFPHIQSCFA